MLNEDQTTPTSSAPDIAETALSVAAHTDIHDIAAYSQEVTSTVLEGSQDIQDRVTAAFPETVSNEPQQETE